MMLDLETKTIQSYQKNLWTSKKCVEYLKERQVSSGAVHTYGIGYFNSNPYDWYYDRMMFPVLDPYGDLMTFQARAMFDYEAKSKEVEQHIPKYWHGKFKKDNKSSILYGLYEAAPKIIELGFCVIVEGPFDVLALYECGIPAVASLGTAFSMQQASLIRRYTRQALSWYDLDDAGRKATAHLKGTLRSAGMPLTPIQPVGYSKDAADTLVAKGKETVKRLVYGYIS